MSDKSHVVATNEGVNFSMYWKLSSYWNFAMCILTKFWFRNAVNPLISVAHKKVYSIPLLLLIGWRGAPGLKDEPQHNVKGKITKKLLTSMGIKYCEIIEKKDLIKLKRLINYSKKIKLPLHA